MEIFQSEDWFANKTIVLVGDLLQLPPVKGKCIFETPNDHKFATLCQDSNLWRQFEVFELNYNHRQGDGNAWANILNEIRMGVVTEETVNIIEERRVEGDHDEYTTCHVFFKNEDVAYHNTKMLNSLDSELMEFNAIETLPRGYIPYIHPDGRIDNTQFLKTLSLKVNARVVLIYNVNTPDGLVNGAMGTLIGFWKDASERVQYVIVSFDSPSTGEIQRKKYPNISYKYQERNGTPIGKESLEYEIGKRKSKMTKASARAKVLQFPLRLAWASTAHKMQVSTLNYFQ